MAIRALLMCGGLTAAVSVAACGAKPPDRRAEGQALLRRMAERLAAAQTITLRTDQEFERGAAGARRTERASVEIALRRPDRFWFRGSGDRELEGVFDGRRVTLLAHAQKVFGELPTPPTIDEALDVLSDRYDVPMPVADLLTRQPEQALLSPDTAGGLDGEEDVQGTRCARLAWRHPNVDWTIWIASGGDPLPRKLRIHYKARGGQPVTTVHFKEWNLSATVPDERFAVQVPAGYEGVAVIQRASRVLGPPSATAPAAAPAVAK